MLVRPQLLAGGRDRGDVCKRGVLLTQEGNFNKRISSKRSNREIMSSLRAEGSRRRKSLQHFVLHLVSVRRFPSFRTQPLEILSVDSVTNEFLSNPAPGENLLSGNLVLETRCMCCVCCHLLFMLVEFT